MSTLPFLLSVADELDNINSQSYLDDFGLGFHPHRQYYRTPTIQLSLPAGTEWMEERQRYRPHKYYDESLNNLQPTSEEDGAQNADDECNATSADDDRTGNGGGPSTSAASGSRQKYTSALNSNDLAEGGCGGSGGGNAPDDDNIDNSVQLYNLSKKCCKNYYRHNASDHHHHHQHGHSHKTGGGAAMGREKEKSSSSGYRLHPKCMESNHSSSEESLQKVSSSIEFLTCFLLKKTRPSKHSGSSSGSGDGSGRKS